MGGCLDWQGLFEYEIFQSVSVFSNWDEGGRCKLFFVARNGGKAKKSDSS